jgi:hypothetical protein
MNIFFLILWVCWTVGYPIYKKGYKKEEVFDGTYKYPCIMLCLSTLANTFK